MSTPSDSSVKKTTGQKTGVESNPVASDNMIGALDSAQPGRQMPNLPPSQSSGAMNTATLTAAYSEPTTDQQGRMQVLQLYAGKDSGPDSLRQTMESRDSREVRLQSNPNFKSSAQESTNPFTSGGNIGVNARMPDEIPKGFDILDSPPRFKPGQSGAPNTNGKAD